MKPCFLTLCILVVSLSFWESNAQEGIPDYKLYTPAQKSISNYKLYTVADGLASNILKSLCVDSDGYLWVGTIEGVNRFDGTTFNTLKPSTGDFTSNAVNIIRQANDRYVLIGTTSGLLAYDIKKNTFCNHLFLDALLAPGSSLNVTSIAPLKNGKCIVSVGRHIFLLDKNLQVLVKRKVADNLRDSYYFPKQAVYGDKDSSLLLVTQPEPCFIETRNLKVVHPELAAKLHLNKTAIMNDAVASVNNSSIFYTSWAEGIFKAGNTRQKIIHWNDLRTVHRLVKYPYDDSTFWGCIYSGLVEFTRSGQGFKKIEIVADKQQYERNEILDVCWDKHGNCWLASVAGLIKVSANASATKEYRMPIPLPPVPTIEVMSVVADRGLGLLVGTWGSFLFSMNNAAKLLRHYSDMVKEPGAFIMDIKKYDDTIFLASFSGLHYYNRRKNRFELYGIMPDSLKHEKVRTFIKDGQSNWWVSYATGLLLQKKNGEQRVFPLRMHFSKNMEDALQSPGSFAEDADHNVYMGNGNYFSNFIRWNHRLQQFELLKPELNGKKLTSINVKAMLVSPDKKYLYLATAQYGVIRYEFSTNKCISYDKTSGLNSLQVSELAFDAKNNLWAGTDYGLSVLKERSNYFTTLTSEDGIPFDKITWLGFPLEGKDSLLIYGYNTFAWIDVTKLKTVDSLPQVYLLRAFANNLRVDTAGLRRFNYSTNAFSFDFASVDLQQADAANFSYRLLGADSNWVYLGKQREAFFSQLSPGNYEFQVRATKGQKDNGLWSEPVIFKFTIAPPWWRTWWAYSLYFLALVSVLYAVYRTRVNELRMRQALQIEAIVATQEQERKRISRDLHDDVGTKLSALKLFLSSLKSNAQNKKYDQLNQLATNSEQLINETITDVREMLLNLSPGILDEFGYISAIESLINKINQTNTINFHLSVFGIKNRLEKNYELALYRITQELINNVLKHSEAKNVSVQMGYRNEKIIVMVEDDGKGFDVSQHKDGYGLKNLETRTKLLNGEMYIDSQPGKGTSTLIEIPYNF